MQLHAKAVNTALLDATNVLLDSNLVLYQYFLIWDFSYKHKASHERQQSTGDSNLFG